MNWDLYLQVIEEAIKNPIVKIICKFWNNWNNRHYHEIDRMLTIGDVMAESINQSLNKTINVTVMPLAVDTNCLKPIPQKNNPFAIRHGLTEKFVVLYSGKMGIGHNIEVILDVAELLRDNTQIQFVFIGLGPKYSVVEKFIAEHKSKNILLLPYQPRDVFPFSMACGDIRVVTQEAKMAHLFMPSKTYSLMACGQAILGIGTSHDDLCQLIRKEHIGVCVTDANCNVVAEKIRYMYNSTERLALYQQNARNIARSRFSLDVAIDKYKMLFNSLMENR